MKQNVIIVNCKVASEAYQILSILRRNPDNEKYSVSQAAVVKMADGKISLEDGFIVSNLDEDRGWTGGLIGSLVGALAGPMASLLGGSVGAMLGDTMDMHEMELKSELLAKASECLVNGETALLLMTGEEDESGLEEMLREFSVTLTRLDAEEVANEIEAKEAKDLAKSEEEA